MATGGPRDAPSACRAGAAVSRRARKVAPGVWIADAVESGCRASGWTLEVPFSDRSGLRARVSEPSNPHGELEVTWRVYAYERYVSYSDHHMHTKHVDLAEGHRRLAPSYDMAAAVAACRKAAEECIAGIGRTLLALPALSRPEPPA